MCVNCIRTQVDITEGIQKQVQMPGGARAVWQLGSRARRLAQSGEYLGEACAIACAYFPIMLSTALPICPTR